MDGVVEVSIKNICSRVTTEAQNVKAESENVSYIGGTFLALSLVYIPEIPHVKVEDYHVHIRFIMTVNVGLIIQDKTVYNFLVKGIVKVNIEVKKKKNEVDQNVTRLDKINNILVQGPGLVTVLSVTVLKLEGVEPIVGGVVLGEVFDVLWNSEVLISVVLALIDNLIFL